MLSIGQALRRTPDGGTPIFSPFTGLKEAGIHIRRGQLSMVAAGSGTGKTALVHAMLHHGDGQGNKNSVLFFSADTSPDVIFLRSAALATGYEQSEIERMVNAGAAESIQAKVESSESHIKWDFAGHIPTEYVRKQLDAWVELNDEYPEVIVLDLLKNGVDPLDGDEFRAQQDLLDEMVALATETGSAVITTTHVTGEYDTGNMPIPIAGLRGKMSKSPAVILTLYRQSDSVLRVSPVKNRLGKPSPDGRVSYGVHADLARMKFSG